MGVLEVLNRHGKISNSDDYIITRPPNTVAWLTTAYGRGYLLRGSYCVPHESVGWDAPGRSRMRWERDWAPRGAAIDELACAEQAGRGWCDTVGMRTEGWMDAPHGGKSASCDGLCYMHLLHSGRVCPCERHFSWLLFLKYSWLIICLNVENYDHWGPLVNGLMRTHRQAGPQEATSTPRELVQLKRTKF
jgi:hypothetical protein